MNHVIEKPDGLDIPIQRIQNFIYNNLKWGRLTMYGRVYKNNADKGVLPQHYKGGGEYLKDVFSNDDDGTNTNVFFIVNDNHSKINEIRFQARVKIVFMVDLEKVFKDEKFRRDALAQKQAYQLVDQKNQFTIDRIETGLNNILRGFDMSGIKESDLGSNHIFALSGLLKYNINC